MPQRHVVNVYHAISCMPAYSGKSFEELRLEDYQAAAMSGEGLRAANAALARSATARCPVAALRVTSDKPFVFGAASAAEERSSAVTPPRDGRTRHAGQSRPSSSAQVMPQLEEAEASYVVSVPLRSPSPPVRLD